MQTLFSPIIIIIDNYVCEQREEEYIIIIDVFVGNIRYIKIADNELYL